MKNVIFIILSLVVLSFVSGAYLFFAACLRRKEMPWLDEKAIKKTRFAQYYDYIVQSSNWLKEHKSLDVYITNQDGLRLHALWIPAENPRGTVLFAHGYRSTVLIDFGCAMDFYHRMDMNILLPTHRSHGKSEGKYITFGVKESRDMQCWIDYHNCNFGELPILLDGLSMGASTMLYLADKDLPENVKGIVADCGFTSPKEIVSQVFRTVTHLPAVPSIWVAELCARFFADFSLYECDTRKVLQNSRLPVLMVHGTGDDFVPCRMTEEGYQACTAEKNLLLVKDAPHGHSFIQDRERYTKMICDFLNRYIFQ